jgi:hypothetical protein
MNTRMCVCYLDSHEAGLSCNLAIHIENIVYYSCFASICDLFSDFPLFDIPSFVGQLDCYIKLWCITCFWYNFTLQRYLFKLHYFMDVNCGFTCINASDSW